MSSSPTPSCTLEQLSTVDIEPALRFDAWRERAHRYVEMAPLAPQTSFQADLLVLHAPDCSFGTMRSSVYATRAMPRRHADAADMVILSLMLGGEVSMTAGTGECLRIGRGSLGLYDLARSACYGWSNASREAFLVLPRREAVTALGHAPRSFSLPLEHCALAPALASQLMLLASQAGTLEIAQRAGLLLGAHALALLVLRQAAASDGSSDGVDGTRGITVSLDAGRYAAALRFMERQAHRPELDLAAVARGTGCSRTRLCAAFAARGETVMGTLRELRLRRAQASIGRGDQPRLKTLSWHCGFANQSSFSRLFKERFGLTPTDALRQAQMARQRI